MIKEVIYDYWEKDLPEVFERETEIDSSDLINDIVGVRRCGKTFLIFWQIKNLLKKIDKKNTIYVNFENRKLFPLKQEYLNEIIEIIHSEKLLEKGKVYIFLDEIQKIKGWEQFVRGVYDEFKGKIKIVVSGSNASLLSKEYGELLTGRHLTKNLMPLNFSEFLKFKKHEIKKNLTEKDRIEIENYLNEYITFGGFPEVFFSNIKEEILSQLFIDIVSKDILSNNIRKENIAEEFAYYLAENVGSLLSFNKMANYFKSRGIKVSVQTLENYFWLMKNAFLFFDLTIFSYKIKDQMQNPRKIYCIDNGLFNNSGLKFKKNYGKLYENIVFLELKRKTFLDHSCKLHYWKSQKQEEVDFVLKEGTEIKQLIQVCYELENPETKKRELKSLIKASKELKCHNLIVINKDVESEEIIGKNKIVFIPLRKWLLNEQRSVYK